MSVQKTRGTKHGGKGRNRKRKMEGEGEGEGVEWGGKTVREMENSFLLGRGRGSDSEWRSGLTFSSSGLPRHCASASQNLRDVRSTGSTGYRHVRSSRCLVKSRVPEGMSRNWYPTRHGELPKKKKNQRKVNKSGFPSHHPPAPTSTSTRSIQSGKSSKHTCNDGEGDTGQFKGGKENQFYIPEKAVAPSRGHIPLRHRALPYPRSRRF